MNISNRKCLKKRYMIYKKSFLSCRYKSKAGRPKSFFNWKNRSGWSASYNPTSIELKSKNAQA